MVDQLRTLSAENVVRLVPYLAKLWDDDLLRVAQVSVAFPNISRVGVKRSVHNSSQSVVEREGRVLRLTVTGDRLASMLPRATLGLLTSEAAIAEPWSAALQSQLEPSPIFCIVADEVEQASCRKSLDALAVRKVFRSSTGLIHTVTCKARGCDENGELLHLPEDTLSCRFCKVCLKHWMQQLGVTVPTPVGPT